MMISAASCVLMRQLNDHVDCGSSLKYNQRSISVPSCMKYVLRTDTRIVYSNSDILSTTVIWQSKSSFLCFMFGNLFSSGYFATTEDVQDA